MKYFFSFHLLFPLVLSAQNNPIELGDVHWLRSMEEAQARSKAENKPILILFQEVPGCMTCRNYGSEVLTIPLMVEAIETHFIPLAVFNNKGGADAEIMKKYNEPGWNNPVVRIVDADGKNLTLRLAGNYTPAGLASLMTSHLIEKDGKAPGYLQLLTDELTTQGRGTMERTYSMYCFWTGEALFGKINGVVETTAGFQDGREVVTVRYDPQVLDGSVLEQVAKSNRCTHMRPGEVRPDATPKYYLSNSKYKNVPMLEIQKCRVNSALSEGQDPVVFLSPRQLTKVNKT